MTGGPFEQGWEGLSRVHSRGYSTEGLVEMGENPV